MDALVGTVIASRYTLEARIGEGGMGAVYRARQEPVGRPVAVKLLDAAHDNDDRMLRRFMNEARIIGQLRHPNTVNLIDFGVAEGGGLFIALDFVGGGTLGDLLRGGRLAPVIALRVALQIARSLAEAHKIGVVHRDLKPDNILLDDVHGEAIFARVTDFGVAKLMPESASAMEPGLGGIDLTRPGTRLGTPAYMSPEQAFGKPLDGRSDLYALGVLLYEMLTGRTPFFGQEGTGLYMAHLHTAPTPLSKQAPELKLSTELDALILSMLAKDPSDRPPNADAVVAALETTIAALPNVALPDAATWRAPALAPLEEEPLGAPSGGGGPPAWLLPVVGVVGAAAGFALARVLS